jgi:hypothetical protein
MRLRTLLTDTPAPQAILMCVASFALIAFFVIIFTVFAWSFSTMAGFEVGSDPETSPKLPWSGT